MGRKLVTKARGRIHERKIKRTERTVGIGLKISEGKRRQFDRLRMMTRLSYTEILEQSLDAFEAAWNTKHKMRRTHRNTAEGGRIER
jgi:hypothetical protein